MDSVVYGRTARWFHWTVVCLLVLQYLVGWFMPDVKKATPATGLIAVHLAIGFAILIVAAIRLLWRFSHPAPDLPESTPGWQAGLSKLVHAALYVFLFALPVTGWLNASMRSWAPMLLAVIPMPRLVPTGDALGHQLGEYHSLMSWVLLALVGLHVIGALFHQFVMKDDLIARMWVRKRA